MKKLFEISVPASTANVGPGFDSIGIALSRYLKIEVFENEIFSCEGSGEFLSGILLDESNLILKTAIDTAHKYNKSLPKCHLKLSSDIPLTRGLGSSASAIVGGILLANELCNLKLKIEEQLNIATSIEGHMDNVGASLFGGLVVGTYIDGEAFIHHSTIQNVAIIAIIPTYELETKHARNILPKTLAFKDAILSSSYSNLLIASLLTENWMLAGNMMKKDLFHEPYRSEIVKELKVLKNLRLPDFVYGYALSGAGPTILAFIKLEEVAEGVDYFKELFFDCNVSEIKIENIGAVVSYAVHQI